MGGLQLLSPNPIGRCSPLAFDGYHCSSPCKLSRFDTPTSVSLLIPCKLSWYEPSGHSSSLTFNSLLFLQSAWLCVTAFAPLAKLCCSSFVSPVLVWTPTATALRWPSTPLFFFPSAWLCAFQLSCFSFLQCPHFGTFSSIFLHTPPLFHAFPSFSCVSSDLFLSIFKGT